MPANNDFKVKQGLRIGTKITSYNSNTAITNGQLLIGNTTSGSFDVATITQGANLIITNAGGAITIAANANSSNSFGTLVLRGPDGSFTSNIITATLYGSANTVSTNAQPNITSVGTLTSLTSSGVVSITNASAATNTTTGALRVTGGISTQNTMYAAGGYFDGVNRTLALVTNGGGITGVISGNTLTLGSNGSSANGASTIVTRGADGSFGGNVITAVYGNIWGNAGTGSATFSGGTTLARLSGSTSSYSEPRLEFGEQTNNATAAISSKNEGNGGGSLYFLTRNTSAASSTVTRMRITGDGNLVVYGNILSNSANSVAAIGNSTNYFGNIFGTAMLARYADLAENYSADRHYEPGTVVQFGGEKEITLATFETPRVAGVISTKPAYLMNMDQQGDNMLAVALQGRVPCKVTGVVHKGDMMVSAGNGYAKACTMPTMGTVIGKALENYFSSVEGVIEVVVGRL